MSEASELLNGQKKHRSRRPNPKQRNKTNTPASTNFQQEFQPAPESEKKLGAQNEQQQKQQQKKHSAIERPTNRGKTIQNERQRFKKNPNKSNASLSDGAVVGGLADSSATKSGPKSHSGRGGFKSRRQRTRDRVLEKQSSNDHQVSASNASGNVDRNGTFNSNTSAANQVNRKQFQQQQSGSNNRKKEYQNGQRTTEDQARETSDKTTKEVDQKSPDASGKSPVDGSKNGKKSRRRRARAGGLAKPVAIDSSVIENGSKGDQATVMAALAPSMETEEGPLNQKEQQPEIMPSSDGGKKSRQFKTQQQTHGALEKGEHDSNAGTISEIGNASGGIQGDTILKGSQIQQEGFEIRTPVGNKSRSQRARKREQRNKQKINPSEVASESTAVKAGPATKSAATGNSPYNGGKNIRESQRQRAREPELEKQRASSSVIATTSKGEGELKSLAATENRHESEDQDRRARPQTGGNSQDSGGLVSNRSRFLPVHVQCDAAAADGMHLPVHLHCDPLTAANELQSSPLKNSRTPEKYYGKVGAGILNVRTRKELIADPVESSPRSEEVKKNMKATEEQHDGVAEINAAKTTKRASSDDAVEGGTGGLCLTKDVSATTSNGHGTTSLLSTAGSSPSPRSCLRGDAFVMELLLGNGFVTDLLTGYI
jgi:hypothetical protein